eukprot:1442485-Heterocapsa_arctica.AAC.1
MHGAVYTRMKGGRERAGEREKKGDTGLGSEARERRRLEGRGKGTAGRDVRKQPGKQGAMR